VNERMWQNGNAVKRSGKILNIEMRKIGNSVTGMLEECREKR